MHNGERATKPRSQLWKSATDCTRFDWRIWICKSRRAPLPIWNSFSLRTTASPCSHVVSVDERRLRSKRRRNWGEIKGKRASFTVGCSCSTSSFTCRCITLLWELLCTSDIRPCEGVLSNSFSYSGMMTQDGELRQFKFRKAISHLVLLLVRGGEVIPCSMVGDLWINNTKNKEGTRKSRSEAASVDMSALKIS